MSGIDARTPREWLAEELAATAREAAARDAAARDAATAERLERALDERNRLAPDRAGWLGSEIARRGGEPFGADEVLA